MNTILYSSLYCVTILSNLHNLLVGGLFLIEMVPNPGIVTSSPLDKEDCKERKNMEMRYFDLRIGIPNDLDILFAKSFLVIVRIA